MNMAKVCSKAQLGLLPLKCSGHSVSICHECLMFWAAGDQRNHQLRLGHRLWQLISQHRRSDLKQLCLKNRNKIEGTDGKLLVPWGPLMLLESLCVWIRGNIWEKSAKWYSFQKKQGSILADGVNRELVAARYDSIFNMTFQNGPLKRKSPKMMQAVRVANSWASSKLISAKLLAIVPTIDVFVLEFLQEMQWAPATLDENGQVPSHTQPRSEHMDDVHGPDKGSQGSEGSQDVTRPVKKLDCFRATS